MFKISGAKYSLKITTRIMTIIMSVLTAFTVVVLIVIYNHSKNTIETITREKVQQILYNSSSWLESSIYSIDRNSVLLMSNLNELYIFNNNNFNNSMYSSEKDIVYSSLNDFVYISDHVQSAFLIDSYDNVYGTVSYNKSYSLDFLKSLAADSEGNLVWYTENDDILLCRQMYDFYLNPTSVLIVFLNKDIFSDLAIEQTDKFEFKFLVCDSNEEVLFANFSNEWLKDITPLNNIIFTKQITIGNVSNAVYSYTSNKHSLTFMYFVPEFYFAQGLSATIFIIIVLLLAFVLTLIIIRRFFDKTLQKPFNSIKNAINFYTLNEDIPEIDFIYHDELYDIYSQLQNMSKRINTLVEDTYEKELLNKSLELSALQQQINPHFIYNTLEIISSLAFSGNSQTISELTVSLSNTLRYTISTEQPETVLSQEVKHVRDYINIQEKRFSNKLKVLQDIPHKMLDLPILKLSLQPIVENCIQHGFKNRWDNCFIVISATEIENGYIVTISDNGVGMSQNVLKNLFSATAPENSVGNGVALKNIHRRLEIKYGKGSGISVSSTENKGTSVVLTILNIGEANDQSSNF